jgi:hypothetical protein
MEIDKTDLSVLPGVVVADRFTGLLDKIRQDRG